MDVAALASAESQLEASGRNDAIPSMRYSRIFVEEYVGGRYVFEVCMCDVFVASALHLYIFDHKIVYYRILFCLEKRQIRQNSPEHLHFLFLKKVLSANSGFRNKQE